MKSRVREFSRVLFLAAGLCFFFPFVTISCSGHPVARLTGKQLATGATLESQDIFWPNERDPWSHSADKKKQQTISDPFRTHKLGGDPYVIVAGIAAIVGLIFSFLRLTKGSLWLMLVGGAGAFALLLFKSKVDDLMLEKGKGMLADYEPGFWLSFLFLLSTALLNAFVFSQKAYTKASVAPTQPG